LDKFINPHVKYYNLVQRYSPSGDNLRQSSKKRKANYPAELLAKNSPQSSKKNEGHILKMKKKIFINSIIKTIAFIILIFFGLSAIYTCKSPNKSFRLLPGQKFPNIILIINDALRGDCLGFNGSQDVLTPNLNQFAARCINFKNAISQSGWTEPSITSILTGLYPIRHRVFNRHRINKLKPTVITLQEVLRSLGYYTTAFVSIGDMEVILRGFLQRSWSDDHKGIQTINRVIQLLEKNNNFPYFIMIHILDPHSPYQPSISPEYPDEIIKNLSRAELQKMTKEDTSRDPLFSEVNFFNYKREIEELDVQYGRLFNYLYNCPDHIFDKKKDIIIFTADHGEEFPHENGYYHHGRSPYIETMRVPLLFYLPGRAPLKIHRYVENASIFPTLLELLGIEQIYLKALDLSTTSLLKFISTPETKDDKSYVLYEAIYLDDDLHKKLPDAVDVHESKSIIRSDGYKLIYDTTIKESKLFDLNSDPQEKYDLLKLKDGRFQKIAKELFKQLKLKTNLLYDYRQLSEFRQ